MSIPQANYVVDSQGKKIFVQLSLQDWEDFLSEFKRVESLLSLKGKLKAATIEMRQIQRGEKEGITLNDLLNEL